MSDISVFVSYSRISIYREGGLRSGVATDPWPSVLANIMKNRVEAKADNISLAFYVYDDEPGGVNWQESISAVAKAKLLLPILSETYFKSATCFFEWVAYVSKNPTLGAIPKAEPQSADNIFPFFRFESLDESSTSLVDDIYKECFDSLRVSCEKFGTQFSDYHDKWARKWIESLTGTTSGMLSNFTTATDEIAFKAHFPSAQIDKVVKGILASLNKGEISANLKNELSKLNVISIIALGLDRFSQGGWGFAMGPDFERDDEGNHLINGRFELNMLVLRALKHALPADDYREEAQSSILWALREENQPRLSKSSVRDRQHKAVALSSLLNSKNLKPLREELSMYTEALIAEVGHTPVTERWVVSSETKSFATDNLIFFDLVSRARSYLQSQETAPFVKERANLEELENNFKLAQQGFYDWVESVSIFKDFDSQVISLFADSEGITSFSKRAASIRGVYRTSAVLDKLLLNFRLISSLRESAQEFVRKSRDIKTLPNLTERLLQVGLRLREESCTDEEISFFVNVFPTYCLAMKDLAFHSGNNSDVVLHAEKCEELWFDLVEALGGEKIGRLTGTAGWSSSIILAERAGVHTPRQDFREIWIDLSTARKERINTILDAVKAETHDEAVKMFDNFVDQTVAIISSKNSAKWISKVHTSNSFRSFFSYGNRVDTDNFKKPTRLNKAIGLLMVDARSLNMVSATSGFNAIYIEPFSASVGLGLKTLERMVHELGKTDKELIAAFSESIVDACWSLNNETGQAEPVNYLERTQSISAIIGSQSIISFDDPGKSYKDLLRLKTLSSNENRYVLRTCSRVTADDIVGVDSQELEPTIGDPLILWTFIDVSKWAESGLFGQVSKSSALEDKRA